MATPICDEKRAQRFAANSSRHLKSHHQTVDTVDNIALSREFSIYYSQDRS
jgi:hypothetical protein